MDTLIALGLFNAATGFKRTGCIHYLPILLIFYVHLFINIYLFTYLCNFICSSQNYKRDLANERADRAKTEREVIELIKDMKKKWKAEAAKKSEEYDVKLNVSGRDVPHFISGKFSCILVIQRCLDLKLYFVFNSLFLAGL